VTRLAVVIHVLSVLVLAACSSSTEPVTVPGMLGPGKWGGPMMGLTVTETEAMAHFDFCAEGTLAVPIALTSDGRFDVKGTYVRNIGPAIEARSARYVGLWRPSMVTIAVFLSDPLGPNESTVVGPFDIMPNHPGPPVRPCPLVAAGLAAPAVR
jgi:hypothetical protein